MPPQLLTPRAILRALKRKVYVVDLATGGVTNRRGRSLKFFTKPSGRKFVRLHLGGRVKSIALARLVWMAATGTRIPRGFEIHHRDECPSNDAWANLIALHKLDHRKQHEAAVPAEEEVPF